MWKVTSAHINRLMLALIVFHKNRRNASFWLKIPGLTFAGKADTQSEIWKVGHQSFVECLTITQMTPNNLMMAFSGLIIILC